MPDAERREELTALLKSEIYGAVQRCFFPHPDAPSWGELEIGVTHRIEREARIISTRILALLDRPDPTPAPDAAALSDETDRVFARWEFDELRTVLASAPPPEAAT